MAQTGSEMTSPESSLEKSAPYQLFMLVLSVYVLVELAAQTVIHFEGPALAILLWADSIICVFFFADFLRSLKRAPDKKRYMLTWGWIDLLSSIPAAPFLRWGRAARVVRLIRILRAVRSARILASFVLSRRAETMVLGAVLLGILSMVAASVTMLQFESGPSGSIATPGDALWWSLVTVTSVGYGDVVPVTREGRLVAMALMTIGVMLFGTLTAYLATWFTRPQEESQDRELAKIRAQLADVHRLLHCMASPDYATAGQPADAASVAGWDVDSGPGAGQRDDVSAAAPPAQEPTDQPESASSAASEVRTSG